MRVSTLSSLLAVAAIVVGVSASSDANADVSGDEFNIAVSGGMVTVTGKGAWHVNGDYPWAIGSDLSKDSKIAFGECHKDANANACASAASKTKQSGTVKVKMGLCNGATCKSITKDVPL
jgi:hypothetical protein